MIKRLEITVTGRVQGVGFRYFTEDTARACDLTGWVANQRDGSVIMEVQGEQERLERFCRDIGEGPALARVNEVRQREMPLFEGEKGFEVRYF